MDSANIHLLLNLLALFFCSVAVYAWDEVYGITKKGRISGGWIWLMAATILAVVGIYPAVGSFFYEIDPEFERYWVVISKVLEGVLLMIAGVVFYSNIYRALRTKSLKSEEPVAEQPMPAKKDVYEDMTPEVRYGVPTDEILKGLLGRLSLYWGPDVSRQMLIQSFQGRVTERQLLRIIADYLPMTDEERWKAKWVQ